MEGGCEQVRFVAFRAIGYRSGDGWMIRVVDVGTVYASSQEYAKALAQDMTAHETGIPRHKIRIVVVWR